MRAFRADYRGGSQKAGEVRGLVRRLRVSVSSGVRWLLLGYDDGDNVEQIDAEAFTGAGFASRPTGQGEAIVCRVGAASGHPVIVATRDQSWSAALGDLEPGESAMFNGASVVRIKADGSITIGSIDGEAVPLATKADLDSLATWIAAHTHATAGSTGTPSVPAEVASLPVAAGTQTLRGE
jgi:phage gp45-like